ncbi:MAG: CPBP family intramembrane glutamic endopeptidase [Hyphomicrobiales bacterium]
MSHADAKQHRSCLLQGWIFYALVMCLAAAVAVSAPVVGPSSLLMSMCTPALATGAMLVLFRGPESGRLLVSQLGLWPLGLRGWPIAVMGPACIFAAGLAVLLGLGWTEVAGPQISGPMLDVAGNLLLGFAVATLLSLAEEIGWRGYLLPRMFGYGVVPAMLLVGLLHGTWHLPLLLTTDYYHSGENPWIVTPMFLVTLTLAGVFYGILRIWTASVWPVAVAHAAVNVSWEIASELSVSKSSLVLEYIGGESGVVMIAGLIIADLVLLRVMRADISAAQRQAQRHIA